MEIEAKFQLTSHYSIRQRILELGGRSLAGRYLERNTRLDTHDRALARSHRLLRVRQGPRNLLTVKQGTETFETRHEYEIEIDDCEAGLELLQALGYEKTVIYEKYREIYALNSVSLMLDELPYGPFVEIEGPALGRVRDAAETLGLDWEKRVRRSYIAIFNRLQEAIGFQFSDATFSNFAGIEPIPPELLQRAISGGLREAE